MTPHEARLAKRVIARSRRVLELRRQLSKAERELTEATQALEQCSVVPVADQVTALSAEA